MQVTKGYAAELDNDVKELGEMCSDCVIAERSAKEQVHSIVIDSSFRNKIPRDMVSIE